MGPQLVTSLRPFPSRRLSKFPSVPHFFKSPSHSGPKQSRTSRPLFLSRDAEVQMRRTHQSKASQHSGGENFHSGGGLRGARRRHSHPAKLLPSFPYDGFWRGSHPPFSKWSTRQGTARSSSAVHGCVVSSWGDGNEMPFYLTKATPSSFPQRDEGRQTAVERERDPCTRHPPTRYAGPPPALPRPLSR